MSMDGWMDEQAAQDWKQMGESPTDGEKTGRAEKILRSALEGMKNVEMVCNTRVTAEKHLLSKHPLSTGGCSCAMFSRNYVA